MKDGITPKMGALVAVLVLALAYLVVLRPQGAALAEASDERQRLERELAQLERHQAQQGATTEATTETADAQLAAAIPASPELSNLFRQINAIATETGMQQTSVTPSALTASAGQSGASMQISLAVSGPADGSAAYLRRLATLDRLFVVEQYTRQGATGAGDIVQLQLAGRVFTTDQPTTGHAG